MSQKDCHQVVGTNARHLYASNSFSLPIKDSLLIPSCAFLQWKEFNADGVWQLRVDPAKKEDRGYLQLSSRRWRYITKQLTGSYPNYRNVLLSPDLFKTKLDFDPAGLNDVLAIISQIPCHDATNYTIGIEVKDGNVSLLGMAPGAEAWTYVSMSQAKAKGDNVTIYVNRQSLVQGLKFDLNTIEMIDGLSPLRMSNGGRQLIIMPINVKGPEQTAATKPTTIAPPVSGSDVKVEDSNVSPETAPLAVSQPERPNMVTGNTPPDADHKTEPVVGFSGQISEALETIDALQDAFKDGITTLKDLTGNLKAIQREHKSTDKELQGFRNTIRSLQSFKV